MKEFKKYQKNRKFLEDNLAYDPSFEHDACGVGLVATTNGKKSRQIVDYGIQALKAVWHRGAVDADGKSGDGAGIQLEISPDFFKEKILDTGNKHDDTKRICVGMIFLPKTDYADQEVETPLDISASQSIVNLYIPSRFVPSFNSTIHLFPFKNINCVT